MAGELLERQLGRPRRKPGRTILERVVFGQVEDVGVLHAKPDVVQTVTLDQLANHSSNGARRRADMSSIWSRARGRRASSTSALAPAGRPTSLCRHALLQSECSSWLRPYEVLKVVESRNGEGRPS